MEKEYVEKVNGGHGNILNKVWQKLLKTISTMTIKIQ